MMLMDLKHCTYIKGIFPLYVLISVVGIVELLSDVSEIQHFSVLIVAEFLNGANGERGNLMDFYSQINIYQRFLA